MAINKQRQTVNLKLAKSTASQQHIKKHNSYHNWTYNHKEWRCCKSKWYCNRCDLIIGPFQVSILMHVLVIFLLLKKLLSWCEWCFWHPACGQQLSQKCFSQPFKRREQKEENIHEMKWNKTYIPFLFYLHLKKLRKMTASARPHIISTSYMTEEILSSIMRILNY